MSVGRRVLNLRASHNESLRDAAVRTGVSHTTIARIEKGEVTGSFHSTLRKIADGYGVRVEYLLTGRDPRQDFELSIRRLPPDERSKLFFLSASARTKMVFDFLQAEYPGEFSEDQLATFMGIDRVKLGEFLENWSRNTEGDDLTARLSHALARATGIPLQWFTMGTIASDIFEALPPESLSQYVWVLNRAVAAQISPRVLELAIDLLISKEREAAAARFAGP